MTTILYDQVLYIDVNTNVNENSNPELLVDVQAINNSLFNIFTCRIGSRPYQRDYGSNLLSFIMEPNDRATADDLLFGLIQSVERWEPRVTVNTQACSAETDTDGSGLIVTLTYRIKRTSRTAAYKFKAQRI